jgi:hypothetical protein
VQRATDLANELAGFVAAEGTFGRAGRSYAFAVSLGQADAGMCHVLQDFLGCGRIRRYPRRRAHYDDEVVFVVRRLRDLVEIVVPFMDEHLRPSHKRAQYERWRDELLTYWDEHARRARPCSVDGCSSPRRAMGLCRGHYYAVFGR